MYFMYQRHFSITTFLVLLYSLRSTTHSIPLTQPQSRLQCLLLGEAAVDENEQRVGSSGADLVVSSSASASEHIHATVEGIDLLFLGLLLRLVTTGSRGWESIDRLVQQRDISVNKLVTVSHKDNSIKERKISYRRHQRQGRHHQPQQELLHHQHQRC
jgi:hypothetical protein